MTCRGLLASRILCVMAACLACMQTSCSQPDAAGRNATVITGSTMGTHYRVTIVAPARSLDAENLRQGIVSELEKVDSCMSTYRDDSELSRLNRFEGAGWFPVSQETAHVLIQATMIATLTDGALDVTVGPLVNLWHFGPDRTKPDDVPTDEQIDQARSRVGIDNIEVRQSPPAVRKKRADVYVDLSSIAKGYAVDQVCSYLHAQGLENYLVDIGGEVKGVGQNAGGQPWRIAIEMPMVDRREIQRVVPLDNRSLATSGDYRNYFEEDGIRYCHIIDPRTGRPVTHRLASVSVVDPSCATADAMATALFVLGPKEGFDLAVAEGLPALFIIKVEDGFQETPTPDFEKLFQ